jgi:hypothetical protein
LDGKSTNIKRFSFSLGDGINQSVGGWIIAVPGGTSDEIVCLEKSKDGATLNCKVANNATTISYLGNGYYFTRYPVVEGKDLVYYFNYDGLNRWFGISTIVDSSASNQEAMNALQQNSYQTYGFRL